jgi:catechol 2,3-dioxygenase-like lactoylglutathione lyase family enzyme
MPDLEATWATAQELGCPVTDEGAGIGKRPWGDVSFYTTDPDGNPLCFIDDVRTDDAPHAAPYAGKPIPNLCKIILPTRDMAASGAFFADLLGLEPDTAVPNRHFFATTSCELALVDPVEHTRAHGKSPAEFRPNPEIVYFGTDELEAALARAEKLGMSFVDVHGMGLGIQRRPWGELSFYGLDPSGNTICFVDDQTLYKGSS